MRAGRGGGDHLPLPIGGTLRYTVRIITLLHINRNTVRGIGGMLRVKVRLRGRGGAGECALTEGPAQGRECNCLAINHR